MTNIDNLAISVYGNVCPFIYREGNMEKVNSVPLYWLANSIGSFQNYLNKPAKISALLIPSTNLKYHLDFFINTMNELPLSKESAKIFLRGLESVILSKIDSPDLMIPQQELLALYSALFSFQAVLTTELPQINIFYINQKRAYDMTSLVNNGEKILSNDDLKILSNSTKERVITDIREATKSLAYEVYTAVGFHIYRAIESIIVTDYFSTLKVESLRWESNKNLGHYIEILEKEKIDIRITGFLKHLKDHYRNPIMHPDEFWDFNKAEQAIGLAASIINIMIKDIQDHKNKIS